MKTSFARSAFLLLLAIANTQAQDGSSTSSESLEEYTARLQGLIEEEFDRQEDALALWVGIADPDYGDLYFVFGNAISSSTGSLPDTPATLDLKFDIGSISKTMGGTTIIRMAEDGIFSLEDTVQQLIPHFAAQFPEYASYTVEELLRMKTIVPDFLNDAEGLLNDYSQDITKRYTPEDIVTYALQKYPSNPGIYSTTNFIVMEVIAEALTNKSIESLVEEYVFQPLELTATTMPNRYSDGVHPRPAATPYAGPGCAFELSSFGYADVFNYEDVTAFSQGISMAGIGGAINSNIYDLLAWAKSGTGDSLLSKEMVDRRHVYDSAVAEGFLLYGMAQYIHGDSALLDQPFMEGWAGHNGDAFGFGANAFRNDELNVSVATGQSTCGYGGMHDAVIRIVNDEIKTRRAGTATMLDESTAAPEVATEQATNPPLEEATTTEQGTTPPLEEATTVFESHSSATLLAPIGAAGLYLSFAVAALL